MIQRKLFVSLQASLDAPEAVVITGMRRVGKTTLLRQVFDALPSKNKLFLDLENPLYQKYFEVLDYEAIRVNLEALGINTRERAFLFLDEIQFCKNIPSVVKYLSDHYAMKFFLTGSVSFYLKNLFSESLAGRKHIYELYPLDFEEFMALKGVSLRIPTVHIASQALYTQFQTLYQEYVIFGGFPGVVAKSTAQEKREALQDIFSSFFNKEVLQLADFRNNAVVRDVMLLLLQRVGSKVDISKLASEVGVSRVTMKEYLAFLEGTYFITLVKPYSRNRDVEIRGMPKVYCIDSGMVNQLAQVAMGHVFEQAIFQQLRARGGALQYYQKKSGVEIDFVVNTKEAYEVKQTATLRDNTTLARIAHELFLEHTSLVSYYVSGAPHVRYGFQI